MTDARRPRWPGADLPGRRLFIAVPLPDAATTTVAELVDRVRAEGLAGTGRDVRWVRLDGLHLTLRFLGPTLEERIAAATQVVRDVAAAVQGFDILIGGGGAFPSPSRPRALWLGVRVGATQLTELAAAVDDALMSSGWQLDGKPFAAHLTLARSDGVPAGAAIAARLAALAQDLDLAFRADRIGLYESLTGLGPARYEPLEIVSLR